jgi:hypothetical protein
MTTLTTIKLGNTDLDVFQLEDGSYAASGLFRLMDTKIYRYKDCWYWLSPNGHPTLKNRDRWDWDRGVILAFQGNMLSYLRIAPIDPEGGVEDANLQDVYSPVPNRLHAIIDFCLFSEILPDEVMLRLLRTRDLCYSGDSFNRAINRQLLLLDTGNDLHRVNARIHSTKP